MKPGGGHAKGSSFERAIGKQLSIWLTNGERGDIFTRNVLSGGKFTNSQMQGKKEGIPGDLMAAHPLAYAFLSRFLIECKHHASLNWEGFVYDTERKSFLATVIAKCRKEAAQSGLDFLIIAKQNRRAPYLLTEPSIGSCVVRVSKSPRNISWTTLHGVAVMPFEHLLGVDPTKFVERVVATRGTPP